MKLLDCRRLTGANVVWDAPGAVADVAVGDEHRDTFVAHWRAEARRMLHAVGWEKQDSAARYCNGGVSVAISAPIDALYAATELCEWAFESAQALCRGLPALPLEEAAPRLATAVNAERNPRLLELAAVARQHHCPFLWDDDHVSVGLGVHARTWAISELPAPAGVDWAGHGGIPVGMVTGTNGKTTTVRVAAAIGRAAGNTVGMSSTDWLSVNDDVLDLGDYSGPGGARTVLRDRRVQLAILETARGGLLRRGLGVAGIGAAAITNVAEDHLGDFGCHTVEELLDIKWLVSRALAPGAPLILNADDARLVARARTADHTLWWFSLHPDNPVIAAHRAAGGRGAICADDTLSLFAGAETTTLIHARDLPIALGGAARHNIANALCAASLCAALGVPLAALRTGLATTSSRQNPGRSNLFRRDGIQVLVDFAHNPHGMAALFHLARSLPAERRCLIFGQAGDRTDEAIFELGQLAYRIGLDRVIVFELSQYARGRQRDEVYDLLRRGLTESGARPEAIEHRETEIESLTEALARARNGDLIIMLSLGEQQAVLDYLNAWQHGSAAE